MQGEEGDWAAVIANLSRVIELPGAPPEQVAMALFNRGATHGQQGDSAAASIPRDRPLRSRSTTHGQQGGSAAAIADYTRVIEPPDAPPEQVAMALFNRGIMHWQQGDSPAAIADYTRLIELPGAPPQQVAKALFNRGITHFQADDKIGSRADFEALLALPDAPSHRVVDAHLSLAVLHLIEGRWSEGLAALEAGLSLVAQQSPPRLEAPVGLIGVFFAAGLNQEGRRVQAGTLYRLYAKHAAEAVLGEALVKHLGAVFSEGAPWPSADNLDQWLAAWQMAAGEAPEFKLPLRLLRTGIEFVKSGGKEEGCLLYTSPSPRD